MQQRVVTVSAIAGLAAFGVLAAVQKACSQAPGRPVRAAVSSSNPTGGMQNNTVAGDAAYNARAGEGRNDTPAFSEPVQAGIAQDEAAEFGRPNPGRPAYADPEFQGNASGGGGRAQGQGRTQGQNSNGGRNGGQAQGQDEGQSQDGDEGQGQEQAGGGDDNVLTVNDGFFFDNYTSGSGFGVYGGEAVTSGQERQLNLPSAGVNARNLGLPILPNQPVGGGQPQQPEEPGNPDS